jgi:hypothetical protein
MFKDIKISKKLTVAILVFAIEFVRGFGLELPPESYQAIQGVAMAYLGGQSLVDSVLAYKGKK